MEEEKTKKTTPKMNSDTNKNKLKQEKKRREEAKERAPLLIRFEFSTDTYEEVLEVRAYEYINLLAEFGRIYRIIHWLGCTAGITYLYGMGCMSLPMLL